MLFCFAFSNFQSKSIESNPSLSHSFLISFRTCSILDDVERNNFRIMDFLLLGLLVGEDELEEEEVEIRDVVDVML